MSQNQPEEPNTKKLSKILDDESSKVTTEDYQKFEQDLYRFGELDSFSWYGACFGQLKRILTTKIPTACVGYKDSQLFFAANPRFLFQLEFKQRCLVYCHEIEHIIRSHLELMEDHPDKASIYNVLMDSIINEALIDYNNIWSRNDFPTWKTEDGGDASMIDFHALKSMINESIAAGAEKPMYSFDPSMTETEFYTEFSTEDLMGFVPKPNQEDGSDGTGSSDIFKDMIKDLYGDAGEFINDGSVPDEVKQTLVEQMVDQASQSRGLEPGHLESYLDKIRDKSNRNWRMMMRGLGRSTNIRVTRSWVKWNKRNPSLSMPLRPGKYFKSLPKVLVMADTSGSVCDTELKGFIKEINGLTEKCEIDMAWVDAYFDENDPEIFYRNIKNTRDFIKRAQKPVGRGGTCFSEFYDYALKSYGKYQHILILTDGYTDYIPKRLVPGQQLLIMTHSYCDDYVQDAANHGFKVAVLPGDI